MESVGQIDTSQGFAVQLRALFREEGRDIGAVIAYAALIGACSLIVPVAVQALVNSIAAASVLQPLVVLSAFVGGMLIFSSVVNVLQLIFVEILQRRMMMRCTFALGHILPRLHIEGFYKSGGANMMPRYLEIFTIQKLVAAILLDGTAVFFQIIVGLTLVSFYHPYFLASSLLILGYVCMLVFVLGIGGVRTSKDQSNAKYAVLVWLMELAKAPSVFKTAHSSDFALRRTDSAVAEYLHHRSRHFSVLLRQHIGALFLQITGSALLLGLGGWLVIRGQLTLGQLVAAELVFSLVLGAIVKLCRQLEKFYDLTASVSKLDSLFNQPLESHPHEFQKFSAETIRLDIYGLKLQSPLEDCPLLFVERLSVSSGEKVVLWGANGSGKSYLANTIYDPSNDFIGRIEINGIATRAYGGPTLREVISITRGEEIFEGTILENLLIHAPSTSFAEVVEFLRVFHLSEKINSLREGLYTKISSYKHPFSHGEALRLMVLRGILANSKLLIIDGTLDGMDAASQHLALEILNHRLSHMSVLLLTHEKSIDGALPLSYRIEDRSIVQSFDGGVHGK